MNHDFDVHFRRHPSWSPICYQPKHSEVVLVTIELRQVTCKKCKRILAKELAKEAKR